jgi:hypothetical protein
LSGSAPPSRALGLADAVSVGFCHGQRYRDDQFDRQSRRLRRTGHIGWIKDLAASSAGGLYFVGALLLVSATLTLLLSRCIGRAPATAAAH